VSSLLSPGLRAALRVFGWGAAFGFLMGAFFVTAVVWRFGNVTLSREGGVSAARLAERAVGTSGMGPHVPGRTPAPGPVIEAVPARELEDRDLLIPVEGVGPDRLTRSFGDARGSRTHGAIDILAPRHTPVRAVEAGTIARLFVSKAGGITIYQFDPARRFSYYYAHLDRYAPGLAEGQPVAKGQVIGYVGVSGNAPKDTPHLHFAIFRLTGEKQWWEGTPVDPYDVLQ
jgi:murein DD-endopeptidase MepM/ murein hydrolase activator NlpD